MKTKEFIKRRNTENKKTLEQEDLTRPKEPDTKQMLFQPETKESPKGSQNESQKDKPRDEETPVVEAQISDNADDRTSKKQDEALSTCNQDAAKTLG